MQIITDTTLQDVFFVVCVLHYYPSADQMVYWRSMESWMMQILKFIVAFLVFFKLVLCKSSIVLIYSSDCPSVSALPVCER